MQTKETVVLGLGSNLGDRLAHLREALKQIKQIPNLSVEQVSPIYISDALLPEQAPLDWNIPYFNLAIKVKTILSPHDLLKEIKKIEKDIGRLQASQRWAPRVIDIDLLAYAEAIIHTETLTVPHENLQHRPFALWPLADVAPTWLYPLAGIHQGKTAEEIAEQWGSRFSGNAPLRTRQIQHRIDVPEWVGVINVTPNSFSDGGRFLQPEKALQQAEALIQAGATILDLGAESTAPSAPSLTHAEEWQRLQPVLAYIIKHRQQFFLNPKISVDTRHFQTAAKAIDLGVEIINDVSGLKNPEMKKLMASQVIDCVVMHHLSLPASREKIIPRNEDPVQVVLTWAMAHLDELEQQGISRKHIIFDPGIGFGKAPEHSLQLINSIQQFKQLGTRLMVGHSRKSFLSLFTPLAAQERDIESLLLTLPLAKAEVDYVRVHHVEMYARAWKVLGAVEGKT